MNLGTYIDIFAGGAGSGRHKETFSDEEKQEKIDKELEENQKPTTHTDDPRDWRKGDKVKHTDGREGKVISETPIGKIVKWSDGTTEHVKGTVGGQRNIKKIRAGGPGSGRKSVGKLLYHGTDSNNAKSILKEGLKPSVSGRVWTTDDLKEARFHAKRTADAKGTKPVILKVKSDGFQEAGNHEKGAHVKYGRVPARYIKVIEGGGPGSGCKGPNCGRPGSGGESPNLKKMSHTERIEYLKKYITEHTRTGDKPKVIQPKIAPAERVYPHSGKGSMGVGKPADRTHEERTGKITGPAGKAVDIERKNAPAPFFKKSMEKEDIAKEKANQAEMRQWQKQHPGSERTETELRKGDQVKTNKVTRAFDNDKLEFKNFKPGTTLTVINVLPKVGSNPQLLSVQYPGRQGDIVHMPVTDVHLHRPLEGLEEKPIHQIREELGYGKKIRQGRIEQQVETPGGAKFTKLKPVSEGRPQGSGNIWKQGQINTDEHSLKGKFAPARGPRGNELKEIFTFDVRMKSFGQGTARASVFDANTKTGGTTVIAWRDTSNKTGKVMEFNRDQHGYIKMGSKSAQQFKNLGHMMGYLSQRYGISMKLPGKSVARKKK